MKIFEGKHKNLTSDKSAGFVFRRIIKLDFALDHMRNLLLQLKDMTLTATDHTSLKGTTR